MSEPFESAWNRAAPWPAYLESVVKNRDLWHAVAERARVPGDIVEELDALTSRVHLLALSEDWCGDAVNLLPVVAKMAGASDRLELRVLQRDENPALMDTHLTGTSRSIPVVMVLDDEFRERGWWGPRPEEIQSWVLEEGLSLPSPERYRHIRGWYARDRGETTARELMSLIRIAVGVTADR